MDFLCIGEKFTLEKVSLLINYDFYNSIKKNYVKEEGRMGSGACGLRVEVLRVTFSRVWLLAIRLSKDDQYFQQKNDI